VPGGGRGVKASRQFMQNEVVCDYAGPVLQLKDGKQKYKLSAEDAMGLYVSLYVPWHETVG